MSFEIPGARPLDEQPCRYGASKLVCRGPQRALQGPYLAFLGDGATFGTFVERPYAALVERALGQICVNLGCANAGLDAFLRDDDLMDIASHADQVVVQVMGAANLGNPYYRVHPRRNDRFLEPTGELTQLFPEVDYTRFNFNKHLLTSLQKLSPGRFMTVADALKQVWQDRMAELLNRLPQPPVLLWLRHQDAMRMGGRIHVNSTLVDNAMIDQLRPSLKGVVEVPVKSAGQAGELAAMTFGPMQVPAATHMIGPAMHATIARALQDELGAS